MKTLLLAMVLRLLPAGELIASTEDQWVSSTLHAMTLNQKLGQMFMVDIWGEKVTPSILNHLKRNHLGNIILFGNNLKTKDQTRALTRILHQAISSRSSVLPLIAIDQEGGPVNRLRKISQYQLLQYPARAFGNEYNLSQQRGKDLLTLTAKQTAEELVQIGVNMNLAPVLDTASTKQAYMFRRSYSGESKQVTALTRSFIEEMHKRKIMATGKHFPNLGNTIVDSHHHLPVQTKDYQQILTEELSPFQSQIDILGAIMVGHLMVPRLDNFYPATLSKKILGLLRNQMKFDGIVITDDIKMKSLSSRFSLEEIIINSVLAGSDIIIVAWGRKKQEESLKILKKAVIDKIISIQHIDASVARILRQKYRTMNGFPNSEPVINLSLQQSLVPNP
jgi:beta-N-acetylhexosaminidase